MNNTALALNDPVADAQLDKLLETYSAMRDAHQAVKQAKAAVAVAEEQLRQAIAAHEAARAERME